MYQHFSTAFACDPTSGQWTRGAEDWMCFLRTSTSLTQPFCPIHLVKYLHWKEATYSQNQNDWMTSVLFQIFLKKRRNEIKFDSRSTLSLDHHEMSLNIDTKHHHSCEILWCLIWSLLHWTATYWILGKYFTRIPLAHRRFCRNFYILKKILTIPIFVSMHRSIWGSRVSDQHTIENLKKRRTLCAENWWLVRHKRQILQCIIFPINCFHSIDSHLVQEIFWILDGTLIVWVILYHENKCLQCWKHEYSPFYKKCFFVVFCNIHRKSFYPRMIWILTTSPILFRRLQWWIAVALLLVDGSQRDSPFNHPSIYQLSTLEKTMLCHRPTLSSGLNMKFWQIVCGDGQARFLGRCPQRVARSITPRTLNFITSLPWAFWCRKWQI